MRLNVKVTSVDIEAGKKCSVSSCPIALAIQKALCKTNTPLDVAVCDNTVRIYDKVYKLPIRARRAVSDYDLGKGMEPFGFTLELKENT